MDINNIENPSFLKKLNIKELEELSSDIRKFLIENISKTGGHLSSNLGIVELTVALHKTFNSPKDKIIFDVGHQAYTHKILTGRAQSFKKLRQYNGLSGFQKRCESIHDVYEAGHSSTSISAGLGFAIARDIKKKKDNIITVIGDGSIGNGLSYEAINHLGEIKTKMIIILNDNEMSISKNIGGLHNSLDKIRNHKNYNDAKTNVKTILDNIPLIGKLFKKIIKNIKTMFKKVYLKDGFLFEELGIKYYGPINGHDYSELLSYLKIAKKEKGPVLIHVITEKGKGYKYSENDIEGSWHGVGPFDIETGKSLIENYYPTWSRVIVNHLIELKKRFKDLMVITPAMTNGSKLNEFLKLYPTSFIDAGIAEEHALVLGTSLSLNNIPVFISIYSTFLQRSYDEIIHDMARMNAPLVIGIDRAGIVGDDGETHQGIYDISFLYGIPNIVISSPFNSIEAGNLLYTAFLKKIPTFIRYSKNTLEYRKEEYKELEIGSWEILSKGKEAYLISYGDMLNIALKVKELLLKDNIDIEIINARYIKPFDQKLLKKIAKTNKKIFVLEEVIENNSLSSNLINYLIKNKLKSNIIAYNLPNEFIKEGNRKIILEKCELDEMSIYKKIKVELKNAKKNNY